MSVIRTNNIKKYAKTVQVAMKEQLEQSANTILVNAQINAPVDEGTLRSSGFTELEDDSATIGFSADYAIYQEFGTVSQEGKFFLSKAFEDESKVFTESIANIIS